MDGGNLARDTPALKSFHRKDEGTSSWAKSTGFQVESLESPDPVLPSIKTKHQSPVLNEITVLDSTCLWDKRHLGKASRSDWSNVSGNVSGITHGKPSQRSPRSKRLGDLCNFFFHTSCARITRASMTVTVSSETAKPCSAGACSLCLTGGSVRTHLNLKMALQPLHGKLHLSFQWSHSHCWCSRYLRLWRLRFSSWSSSKPQRMNFRCDYVICTSTGLSLCSTIHLRWLGHASYLNDALLPILTCAFSAKLCKAGGLFQGSSFHSFA